jgi:hypothetical protein
MRRIDVWTNVRSVLSLGVVNGNMFTGVHNDEIKVRLSEADRSASSRPMKAVASSPR